MKTFNRSDLSDVHTNELFRIYALEETADGGMKVDCYIAPQVVERIVNEWIIKVLDEKIEETLRSEAATREVAEKEGGSSDTVEANEATEDVSRTDWGGSFTYPHER